MIKLIGTDIKRLMQNKIAIIIAMGAPLLLAALIGAAVAPFFYADVRTEDFHVAVYNEDNDPLTVSILQSLIESESLGGLIETRFVSGEQEGMQAVQDGAAAFIHIPKNMQDDLLGGGNVAISYFGNVQMPLEDALLYETLSSGTALVSHAQHAVNVLYEDCIDDGIDRQIASDVYRQTSSVFFVQVLSRSQLFEHTEQTSPLDGALPIEYYAVSLLVLFVALGGMPITRITADDSATGLIHRQLLSGFAPLQCFVSRWLAGSVFLFVQYAVLTAALCIITGAATAFFGNIVILIALGILLCALVSLGMMMIGLLSRSSAVAVGICFFGVLALALIGGLLVPSAYMPMLVRDVSVYTPFSAALRMGISGMFDGQASGIAIYMAIIAAYIGILLPLSLRRFQRRTH